MLSNKNQSVGFITPRGIAKSNSRWKKFDLYAKEKQIIKKDFSDLGGSFSWNDKVVSDKLEGFAKQVIKVVDEGVTDRQDIGALVLPIETIGPGDTYVQRDLHGVNIYFGTYGGAVRMSRPQFTQFTKKAELKEIGLKLQLEQIRTGKYSPSELADYTTGLITAWRNNLLFRTTLGGIASYGASGSNAVSGAGGLSFATMSLAFGTMTDEADVGFIVGRRNAIHAISNISGWSDTVIDEFKSTGMIGQYAGVPVMKVNSFADPDYGTVYPMDNDSLWLFSEKPAGRTVVTDTLRTSQETILRSESMNMYFRWDDAYGIFYEDRIAHIRGIV